MKPTVNQYETNNGASAENSENLAQQFFFRTYKGMFHGILRWPKLDTLWKQVIASKADWYIYSLAEAPPEQTVSAETLSTFINEINGLLRREHDEDYCGIVYTDNSEKPTLIKIFDPNNIGTSCGTATTPPLPGWILTTLKPVDLPAALQQEAAAQPNNRKRWWSKLFG